MRSDNNGAELSSADWDAFVERQHEARFAHLYGWRGLLEDEFGHDTAYLFERDYSGALSGVLPLIRVRSRLFGNYAVSMPCLNYGSALVTEEGGRRRLFAAAAEQAAEWGVSHAELRDVVPFPGWQERTDKVAMELPLPDSYDALMKEIGAKVRSQVKRPVREGATVEQGGRELLDEFYTVFARNMRDLGTPVYSKRFFSRVLKTFPENCHLFVVRVNGTPAAAGVLLGFRDRLEIPWASSVRDFNRIGVNMLLYSEVLRYAIESGYKLFDFGRSTRDAGTYKFKAQWGAKPRQLYWNYWLAPGQEMPGLTPSNPKFQLAIRMWQKLPVPVANLLGPHIVRGLP